MLKWESDREQICELIRRDTLPMKIVLKTKNDALFLNQWIRHHSHIVGLDGLIIVDNNSDDPEVLKVYEHFGPSLTVFQFSGFHNDLHEIDKFQPLYDAVRASCSYYCFIDTDEFLYWMEADGSYVADRHLVSNVLRSEESVIPGVWAENHRGFADVLRLTFEEDRIYAGLVGGKPILKASVPIEGFINHNVQLPPAAFEGCRTANVIVAHRKFLSREQRIAANMEKLRNYNRAQNALKAYGISGSDFTVADVMAIGGLRRDNNIEIYIQEIVDLTNSADVVPEVPERYSVEMRDGMAAFNDRADRARVLDFIANPEPLIRACLIDRTQIPSA